MNVVLALTAQEPAAAEHLNPILPPNPLGSIINSHSERSVDK